MTSEQQRHRVLAGISRSRLLAVLNSSERPMGVRELADSVDLHPNTAREHLDQLVEAGLVSRKTAAPAGRGRPGLRYRAAPRQREEDPQAYLALASVLATELAQRSDAQDAAKTAGERWGEAAARALPVPGAADAVDGLLDLLDGAGFDPLRSAGDPTAIELHRCPFGSLARERADVVCNVHLGLMRGALRELGAPLDAVSLQPFVRPDLCLAHLGARTRDR